MAVVMFIDRPIRAIGKWPASFTYAGVRETPFTAQDSSDVKLRLRFLHLLLLAANSNNRTRILTWIYAEMTAQPHYGDVYGHWAAPRMVVQLG